MTTGWRQLQIIPVALTASAGVNAMAGWPSWLAINSELGPVLTQIAGLATIGLSVWLMGVVIRVVSTESGVSVRF